MTKIEAERQMYEPQDLVIPEVVLKLLADKFPNALPVNMCENLNNINRLIGQQEVIRWLQQKKIMMENERIKHKQFINDSLEHAIKE